MIATDGTIASATATAPDPTSPNVEVDIRGTERERCAAAAIRETHFWPFEGEPASIRFQYVVP